MYGPHNAHLWQVLDPYEVHSSPDRRRLYAGGFVLADSFDAILRQLSEDYLRVTWQRLKEALDQYRIASVNLSWGWLHPGYTHVPGLHVPSPSDYTGWTNEELWNFDEDSRSVKLDRALCAGQPALLCAVTARSLKWRIAPDDFAMALKLIEALWTDEVSDWAPQWITQHAGETNEPWRKVARALAANDQKQLDRALHEARSAYTSLGYRIVVRGYQAFLAQPGIESNVRFPAMHP